MNYSQACSPPCKGGVAAPLKKGPVPNRRGRGGRSEVTLRQYVLERGVSATTPTAPFKDGFAAFY